MRHRTALIVGAILGALLVGGLVLSIGDPSQGPTSSADRVTLPRLGPGAGATYEGTGPLYTLTGAVHTAPRPDARSTTTVLKAGDHIAVTATRGEVLDGRGTMQDVLLLQASLNGGETIAWSAHTIAAPLAEGARYHLPSIDPSLPPSTQVAFRLHAGLFDGWIFEGTTLVPGRTTLPGLVPWTEGMLLFNYKPATDVEVEVLAPASDGAAWTVVVSDDTWPPFRFTYELTPECAFPRSARYEIPPGTLKSEVTRLSCTMKPAADLDAVRGSTMPVLEPYGRTMPGTGEQLPSPYRRALSFFLQLEDVHAFTSAHPDWILHCLWLARDPENGPFYEPWSWGFGLTSRTGDEIIRWVHEGARDVPSLLRPGFGIDPVPPVRGSLCYPEGGDILRGLHVAQIDHYDAGWRRLVREEVVRHEGVWEELSIRPPVAAFVTIDVDRCGAPARENVGFCDDFVPQIALNADASVRHLLVPLRWLRTELQAPFEANVTEGSASPGSP